MEKKKKKKKKKGIDDAVANNEVPGRARELPFLLRKVCLRRNDCLLQEAIMVLMNSVKTACRKGWFSVEDSGSLLHIGNEITNSFSHGSSINFDASNSLRTLSTIMARFYPRMKMGQILAYIEAKLGHQTFMIDFHVSKPEDKLRLFVAKTDDIEKSSCLKTPPQVKFLVNEKELQYKEDTGPQLPTILTNLLTIGSNLLQVEGDFDGNYVILLAFVTEKANLDHSFLRDYVQPASAAADSDTEIAEGPSRISLNCPISSRRITTPVKGHACRHLQCFDLETFVDANSRNPLWRCPLCNRYVCYTDIRIDQKMTQILREVAANVDEVNIAADGSWKAVVENEPIQNQSTDETFPAAVFVSSNGAGPSNTFVSSNGAGPSNSRSNALQIAAPRAPSLPQNQSSAISNVRPQLAVTRPETITVDVILALPAHTQTRTSRSVRRPRSRVGSNNLTSNTPTPPLASRTPQLSSTDRFNPAASSSLNSQTQYARSHSNVLNASRVTPSLFPQNSTSLIRSNQEQPISSQPAPPTVGLPGSSRNFSVRPNSSPFPNGGLPGSSRTFSILPGSSSSALPNAQSNTHSPFNFTMPSTSAEGYARYLSQRRVGSVEVSNTNTVFASPQIGQVATQPPLNFGTSRTPSNGNNGLLGSVVERGGAASGLWVNRFFGSAAASGSSQPPVPRAENPVELEENWRPTRRMRESYSGPGSSDAGPSTVQPNVMGPPPGLPNQLEVLVANNRIAHGPGAGNIWPRVPPSSSGAGPSSRVSGSAAGSLKRELPP